MSKTLDESVEEQLYKDLYYLHLGADDDEEDYEIREPGVENEIPEIEQPVLDLETPEKNKNSPLFPYIFPKNTEIIIFCGKKLSMRKKYKIKIVP